MSEELTLLPCPFCGSRDVEVQGKPAILDALDSVCCNECTADAPYPAWNTRAQLPSRGGEAVEVVAYIDDGGALYTSKLLEIMSVESDGCEPLMTVAQHKRMMLALVARCYQEGAFKTCLECGYQDGHDQICQYHESKRAAASDDLTNVRCLCCQSEHAHNSYDAGFIAGSGMCQACDAAMPAKDLPAVSAEPVEWQHQAPDGSWWGIAKSRVDEARLAGRPIRPLYTHPADQVADDLTMVKVPRELANIAALHLENSGYTETGKKLRALLNGGRS